jgi:preprotein translocase subunit SecE
MNQRPQSRREARKETRAILVFAVIVVIGIILLAYQYWG